MDYERIKVEVFIKDMKKYYETIIDCGSSPEEFFDIAREKNKKLLNIHEDSHSNSDSVN